MVDQFVTLEYAGSEFEANQIRNLLAEHGIDSLVDGASSATTMSHLGLACSVRVVVRQQERDRAIAILRAERDGDACDIAWICPTCGEEVDGGFDTCWACGGERTDDALPVTSPPTPPAPVEPIPDLDLSQVRLASDAGPFNPPLTVAEPRPPVPESVGVDEEAEATIMRAWRATWVGFVWAPLLLHLYAVVLLIGVGLSGKHVSEEKIRLWWTTMAVNLMVLVPVLVVILMLLR